MSAIIPAPFPNYWQSIKVLPTVYDESLSYYEVLTKITLKVNEVIQTLETWQADNKAYTDTEVEKLRVETTSKITDLQTQLNALSADFSSQKEYIDKQDNLILNKLNENYIALVELMIVKDTEVLNKALDVITTTDNVNRIWTQQKLDELRKLIDEVNENGFTIFNPLKGYNTKVGDAVNEVYNALRYFALNANEYDMCNLTAESYDAKNILAVIYDTESKKQFPKYFYYLFSPFSGELVSEQTAINEIAQAINNGLTANDYDVILITATAYDNLQLTAYAYDWNGKTLVHK